MNTVVSVWNYVKVNIKSQGNILHDQMIMKEFSDPFTGEEIKRKKNK